MPNSLSAAPQSSRSESIDTSRTQKNSQSFKEILKNTLANLDQNPELSSKEEKIYRKTLRKLESTYKEKLDTLQLNTEAEIADLKREIQNDLDALFQDEKFSRTDVVDLSKTVAGVIRRKSVEKTLQENFSEMTLEDLRELPIDTLIGLENKHEGILLYAFTDFIDAKQKIDLSNFENFYKAPSVGTQLRVDFRGNKEAENKLGAADILPPSVRQVTVHENGDPALARTSERRLGLKGQNKSGHGFFDEEGYIPIFSGDTMIVGGVDMHFEKNYRKSDGSLDYDKYEGNQKKIPNDIENDVRYLQKLKAKGKSLSKTYTEEDLANLEQKMLTNSADRKELIQSIKNHIGKPGDHCWDWVNKVYNAAGFSQEKRVTVYQHSKYEQRSKGKKFNRERPGKHENPSAMKGLQPGDWVFFFNQNKWDAVGDHSALFLRWIDAEKGIAEMASCPGADRPGRIHHTNFMKTPITTIIKPVNS